MFAVIDETLASAPTGLDGIGNNRPRMRVAETSVDQFTNRVKETRKLCERYLGLCTQSQFPPPLHRKASDTGNSAASGRKQSCFDGYALSWNEARGTSYATNGSISVMVTGSLMGIDTATKDGVSTYNQTEAQRLLEFYHASNNLSRKNGTLHTKKAIALLHTLRGGFTFVLIDATPGPRRDHPVRVLAARDSHSNLPLHWGCTPEGALLFSTRHDSAMEKCTPSATEFPKGCLFVSTGGVGWEPPEDGPDVPGVWSDCCGDKRAPSKPGKGYCVCFSKPENPVRAIPRINSRGHICGAMFKVDSAVICLPDSPTSTMRRSDSQTSLHEEEANTVPLLLTA